MAGTFTPISLISTLIPPSPVNTVDRMLNPFDEALLAAVPLNFSPDPFFSEPPQNDHPNLQTQNISNCLDPENIKILRDRCCFLKNVHIRLPNTEDRAHLPLLGHLTVYQEELEAGLRLSIAPLLVNLSNHWDISISQLTPNALRVIAGFTFLCRLHDIPLSLDTFRMMLKLSPTKGFFYISPELRANSSLWVTHHLFMTGKVIFLRPVPRFSDAS
ncbi:hypothetical protein ACH5RR_040176 [Cinchona calisaya]|uniref:Transposase (putative) gypsy type domain-containing protein n=1 Tax=Cinchona calisaya TaxID=153742 RepID=A0ABD2XRK7_9GENT